MKLPRRLWFGMFALIAAAIAAGGSASAQTQKLNILFVMGDDIGWMQVGVYHQGVGLGGRPGGLWDAKTNICSAKKM